MCHESHQTRNRKCLCCRGPAAIYRTERGHQCFPDPFVRYVSIALYPSVFILYSLPISLRLRRVVSE
jgi:hypothetical protein